MRSILKHKRSLALVSLFIFLLLLVESIRLIKKQVTDKTVEIKSYKELDKLNYYENGNWIINKNVVQYSVYTIYLTSSINFDVLVVLTEKIAKNFNQLKCVIKHANKLIILSNYRFDEIKAPLFKLRCQLNNPKIVKDASVLYVSVIYESDINFSENQNEVETIKSDQIPYDGLQLQASALINSSIERKKAVVHCLKNLNFDSGNKTARMKMNNWIGIQQKIGIDHIRVYVEDLENVMVEYLSTKYRNYLTLVQNSKNYSTICGGFQIMVAKYPTSSLQLKLLQICNSAYKTVFLKNIFNTQINDLIIMNDCLLNFKYTYEFITNYNADEVIFPRFYEIDQHHVEYNSLLQSTSCNQDIRTYNQSYNIYNYLMKLFSEYNKTNTACLRFTNVEFFAQSESLGSFLNKVEDSVSKAKTGTLTWDIDNQGEIKINFSLTDFDFLAANDILEFHKKLSCFLKKNKIAKKVVEEFQRHLAIDLPHGSGKLIINTRLTEAIHSDKFCMAYSSNFDVRQVNTNKGFVSRFQKKTFELLNDISDIYPFSRIISDTEFSIFINNLALQEL